MGALLHLFALRAMNRLIFTGQYSTSTDLQSVIFLPIKHTDSVLLVDDVCTYLHHSFVMITEQAGTPQTPHGFTLHCPIFLYYKINIKFLMK